MLVSRTWSCRVDQRVLFAVLLAVKLSLLGSFMYPVFQILRFQSMY